LGIPLLPQGMPSHYSEYVQRKTQKGYEVEHIWANHPEHIASRIRAHERLMEHWRRVLPMPLLEVDYEETVADLEGTARRLVDWCGLDWEPGCLAFHERRQLVRTASAMQVRQPIYRNAV
jgi:hypothetical protein